MFRSFQEILKRAMGIYTYRIPENIEEWCSWGRGDGVRCLLTYLMTWVPSQEWWKKRRLLQSCPDWNLCVPTMVVWMKMAPIDTAIRILNPQLVECFRKEGLEGVALLEELCHWGQALGFEMSMLFPVLLVWWWCLKPAPSACCLVPWHDGHGLWSSVKL